MKKSGILQAIAYLFIAFLNFSCVIQKNSALPFLSKESYCVPPKYVNYFKYNNHTNADSVLNANSMLRLKFSAESILIMNVLRINDEVYEIVKQSDKKKLETSVRLNALKQQIDNRVWLANSEIDALSAELDCEGERIDQIAQFIDDKNSKSNNKLTVASIVIGAVSGITSVLITKESINNGVAIGAGVIGAGLGFATLNPKGKKIELITTRNLLRDIWLEQNNNDISPFVWYMLTEPRFSNTGKSSLLKNTKNRWLLYQFDDNLKLANQSVNFSSGGIYFAEDLHARSQMINQLQSVVRSTKQNLNVFIAELTSAFD